MQACAFSSAPANAVAIVREQADLVAKQVIKPSTSDDMRFLFEWNGVNGSGRNARVEGFNVGGKTGTAKTVLLWFSKKWIILCVCCIEVQI